MDQMSPPKSATPATRDAPGEPAFDTASATCPAAAPVAPVNEPNQNTNKTAVKLRDDQKAKRRLW